MTDYPNDASCTILALDKRHIWHPFTQMATAGEMIEIAEGKGAILRTPDGHELVDMISSWWVNIHGHAHPAIAGAIAAQASRLEQVIFADFTHAPAAKLAARLAGLLPGGLTRVFYSDNGSTSVEVALKIAYQYWRNLGQPRERFLALEGGYHGDTVGAMSAGAESGFYEPFRRLMFPVEHLPFPETWDGDEAVESKEKAALEHLDCWLDKHGAETAALIIEPLIQGAAGMRMCRPGFVRELVARVRAHGILVIFDEVMTGFGRTGSLFACVGIGTSPDIICLSKGLTGGFLPLSATVVREDIYDQFLGVDFSRAFAHGHSFTANPLGCAAALASLDLTEEMQKSGRWAEIEAVHRERLNALSGHASLRRGRVTGTISAIEFARSGESYAGPLTAPLKSYFYKKGFLLRPLGAVMYLMPPYCVSDDQLHRAYDAIEEAADTLI